MKVMSTSLQAVSPFNYAAFGDVSGVNFRPEDNGMAAWTYDPLLGVANPTTAPISQTVYMVKLKIVRNVTVSNIVCNILTAGATFTSSSAALYDNNGNKLQETASQNAVWNSTGIKTMAITSQALTVGQYVHVAFRATATTMPRWGGVIPASDMGNVGLGSTDLRFASGPTGQTAMPSSITMSSRSNYSSTYIWAGLS